MYLRGMGAAAPDIRVRDGKAHGIVRIRSKRCQPVIDALRPQGRLSIIV